MEVEEGDTYLGEGKTLFSIANSQNFIVSASVDEYDVSSISKDMTAAVIVEALGTMNFRQKCLILHRRQRHPHPETVQEAPAMIWKLPLDDENADLRIGMTAKASIVKEAVYDVLTVPYDCVTTDEDGNSSVTIDKDGERFRYR